MATQNDDGFSLADAVTSTDEATLTDDQSFSLAEAPNTEDPMKRMVEKVGKKVEKKMDHDENYFTEAINDEEINKMHVVYKYPDTSTTCSAYFDLIHDDIMKDAGAGQKVFPREIRIPILRVKYAYVHGVGPDSKKYPKDYANRRDFRLLLTTNMTDQMIKEVNHKMQEKGYENFDIKEEHKKFNEQMLATMKMVEKSFFENPKIHKDEKKAINLEVKRDFEEFKLTDEQIKEKIFKRYCKQYVVSPMKVSDENENEYDYSLSRKVFRVKDYEANNHKDVPITEVDRFTEKKMKENNLQFDKKEKTAFRHHIMKKMCEANGFILNPYKLVDHKNRAVPCKDYREPWLFTNFLVTAGFRIKGNVLSGASKTANIKLQAAPVIQIIKMFDAPEYTADPDNFAFGDAVTESAVNEHVDEKLRKYYTFDEDVSNLDDCNEDDKTTDGSKKRKRKENDDESASKRKPITDEAFDEDFY